MCWDVFISHASEDKEAVAKPLALALHKMGLDVWYDEFSLTVGDQLRRCIDHGLAQSRYGIVILSPHFFAKEWPQRELDGLLALEEGHGKRILPVWHRVTSNDVKQFSPILSYRVGASTARGIQVVAQELFHVVRHNSDALKLLRPTKIDGIRIAEELEAIFSGRKHTAKLNAVVRQAFEYLFTPELTYERRLSDGRHVYRLVPMSEGWIHVHSRYEVDYVSVFVINGEPTLADLQRFRGFRSSPTYRFGVIVCGAFPHKGSEVLRRRREDLRENGILIFFLGPEFLRRLLSMTSRNGRDNALFKRLKKVELDIIYGR